VVEVGRIVILNGVSRAGKSSLPKAVQQSVPGMWMHIEMGRYVSISGLI
jgi:chloramphenicol 3-O-phosphotransferase